MYRVLNVLPDKTDRESILAAAIAEVDSGEGEHLAIRSVAGRLGLAPNALYHYSDTLRLWRRQ